MMERNKRIKPAPQRFQDSDLSNVDICICFDEGVFDLVVEGRECIREFIFARFAVPKWSGNQASVRIQHARERSSCRGCHRSQECITLGSKGRIIDGKWRVAERVHQFRNSSLWGEEAFWEWNGHSPLIRPVLPVILKICLYSTKQYL